MRDARRQNAEFEGEGPYLIGWSPSNSRGVPDKLVLVIDMSSDGNQARIDQKFLFWKGKIVKDPQLWRHGFSLETFRLALRNFANEYGADLIESRQTRKREIKFKATLGWSLWTRYGSKPWGEMIRRTARLSVEGARYSRALPCWRS